MIKRKRDFLNLSNFLTLFFIIWLIFSYFVIEMVNSHFECERYGLCEIWSIRDNPYRFYYNTEFHERKILFNPELYKVFGDNDIQPGTKFRWKLSWFLFKEPYLK